MHSGLPTIAGTSLQPDLQVSLESVDGTITVLPQGELDLAMAPQLTAALRLAQTSAAHAVILDLRGVTFMDVSGMRAILNAQAQAQAEGSELRIIRCPGPVQRVFDICRAIDPSLGTQTA